jgi:hypothetical protein
MRPPMRAGVAALLSCSIYALPLVGPHASFFLGESLLRTLRRGEHSAAWTAAEIAVAFGMQAGAAAIWYWILGRLPSLRLLVLVLAVPAFFAFAQWCYLIALPARFLIEADVSKEQRSWSVGCTIPNETLIVVGYKRAVVRSGDPLLVADPSMRLARMTISSPSDGQIKCSLSSLDLPVPTGTDTPVWIDDDGRVLLRSTAKQTGAQSWLWIPGPGATPVRLEEPVGRRSSDGPPVIARDGRSVAWLTPAANSGQPPVLSIVSRRLPTATTGASSTPAPSDEVVIDLSRLGPASFVLLDVDPAARQALLAMDERRFVTVGFDGTIRGEPLRPEGVEPLHMTFRRLGDGWVAWDGYKEDGYTIAWSLPAGRGVHRVPRGRSITDVGVHPDGRLIALSVTTSLSIGDVRDAVYVLRVADGAEVFRRYLVRYARSSVLFPAADLFAYTDWDSTRATTVVLRIPPDVLR